METIRVHMPYNRFRPVFRLIFCPVSHAGLTRRLGINLPKMCLGDSLTQHFVVD